MLQNLEHFGAVCELEDVGEQILPDGSKLQLPPILFGHLGNDPKKKTICIYGHLDVQPALKVKFGTVFLSNFIIYLLIFISERRLVY